MYRYRGSPEHGASHTGEVSKVIGAQAERIRAGKASGPPRQETLSMVYHVVDGEVSHIATEKDRLSLMTVVKGASKIGEETFTWKKGDTFCIPSWYPYQVGSPCRKDIGDSWLTPNFQHFAGEQSDCYLYRFDDYPMISSLGFYRTSSERWYEK